MTYQLDTPGRRANARSSRRTSVSPAPRGALQSLPLGDPTGGADAREWRKLVDGKQRYPRVAIDRSAVITMSDGVRLRATTVRPANRFGHPITTPYPVIVNINPYNRAVLGGIDKTLHAPVLGHAITSASAAIDGTGTALEGITQLTRSVSGGSLDVFGINRNLVRSGYSQVIVDVRGTGASQGKWQILGAREQQDSIEIIDWAASRAWSNGKVGLAGWSYSAINSLQAADKRPPALGAVFAVEGCDDIVRDIYITGGMPSAFIPAWLSAVNLLKWVPNPSTPVRDVLRGDAARWLRDRVKSPVTEMPSLGWGFLTARDDRIFDDPYFDERDPKIDQIDVPTFTVGAWHDLFGHSATNIYNRLKMTPGRKQAVIGNGYHFDVGSGFGGKFTPPRLDVLERAWFDRWLKDADNGVEHYGPVTMLQQGGAWTSGDSFPRRGVSTQQVFLTSTPSTTANHAHFDGSLEPAATQYFSSHSVRPNLYSVASRDTSQVTAGATIALGKAFSVDARTQERGGLSFTTAPMPEAVSISGSMNLHLNVETTGHEGIWAVTVNDVAPDGRSTVLTNGALTVSNRALDESKSTYDTNGNLIAAHHFLTREAKLPVPADRPVEIDVDVVPTDAIIEAGHRLRVDVYAASIPRYLTVVPDLIKARGRHQRLVLDPDRPSYLTLLATGPLA